MNSTIVLYIICEIISIIFMYLAEKNKNNNNKITRLFLILSFLPFAILLIFRGLSVGTDYKTYANAYLSLINGTLDARQEEWLSVGFKGICYVLSFIFKDNYFGVFAVINLLTLGLLYKVIWDNSEKPTLALFVMLCFCLHFQIFNQFRQMLALAITFYAFKYLTKRKPLKYIMLITCAGLVHTSAFIMLPMYFINSKEMSKKRLLIYILLAIIAFICFDWIKVLLFKTYYGQIYFGSSFDVTEKSSIYNLVVRIVMFIIVYFYYNRISKENKNSIYMYNNVFFCTLLQLIVVRSYILARLTTYFYVYYILLIPIVLERFISNRKNKEIWFILFILGMILYQFVYYNSSSGAVRAGYDIYKTFLN